MRGRLYLAGIACPIVGRVSMDVTAIDVTHVPRGAIGRGAMAQVIGPDQGIDDLARAGGTIGYEVLTRLGLRHTRVYSAATSRLLQSGAEPA
jgi:alanine racemase